MVYIQYVGNHMDDQIQCPHYGLFSFPYDHFAVIRWQATRPGSPKQKLRKYSISSFANLILLLPILYKRPGQKTETILKEDPHEGKHRKSP